MEYAVGECDYCKKRNPVFVEAENSEGETRRVCSDCFFEALDIIFKIKRYNIKEDK